MTINTIIAYTAGSIGFITSLPQLMQIIKTKTVRDLNPYFFVLHSISDILYITYGVLADDLLLSYSLSLPTFCNICIFILWIKYKDND
jgi:uncharacterized protein with PQ loop repeat